MIINHDLLSEWDDSWRLKNQLRPMNHSIHQPFEVYYLVLRHERPETLVSSAFWAFTTVDFC